LAQGHASRRVIHRSIDSAGGLLIVASFPVHPSLLFVIN
jgi:hypothetical protein